MSARDLEGVGAFLPGSPPWIMDLVGFGAYSALKPSEMLEVWGFEFSCAGLGRL